MILALDQIFKSRLFFWIRIAQFALAIGIFTVAALAPAELVRTNQPDNIMHFVGNVLLFLSASVASGNRLKLWTLAALLLPYSMLIEISQWFTISRQVDPKDAAANISGLLTGFLIAYLCEWIWVKIKSKSM